MGAFSVLKAMSVLHGKCSLWYPVQAWTPCHAEQDISQSTLQLLQFTSIKLEGKGGERRSHRSQKHQLRGWSQGAAEIPRRIPELISVSRGYSASASNNQFHTCNCFIFFSAVLIILLVFS